MQEAQLRARPIEDSDLDDHEAVATPASPASKPSSVRDKRKPTAS
jgi:hypothetical protein